AGPLLRATWPMFADRGERLPELRACACARGKARLGRGFGAALSCLSHWNLVVTSLEPTLRSVVKPGVSQGFSRYSGAFRAISGRFSRVSMLVESAHRATRCEWSQRPDASQSRPGSPQISPVFPECARVSARSRWRWKREGWPSAVATAMKEPSSCAASRWLLIGCYRGRSEADSTSNVLVQKQVPVAQQDRATVS